jgi:hypothetical protein
MKCNKPYTVKSDNAKMSGSEKPKSYMGGGMIKSYQMGGMVEKPMPAKSMSKGPSRRLGPAKVRAEREMRMGQAEGEEMTKKTQGAYKRFYGK